MHQLLSFMHLMHNNIISRALLCVRECVLGGIERLRACLPWLYSTPKSKTPGGASSMWSWSSLDVVFGYEGVLNSRKHGFQGVFPLLLLLRRTCMSYFKYTRIGPATYPLCHRQPACNPTPTCCLQCPPARLGHRTCYC